MESTNAHLCTQTHVFVHAQAYQCTHWGKPVHCRFTGKCNPHTVFLWGMHTQTHGCTLGNVVCTQPGVCEQVQWIKLKGFDDWGNPNTRTLIPFTLLVKQTCDKLTQSDGYTVHYWGQSTSATISESSRDKMTVMPFTFYFFIAQKQNKIKHLKNNL